MGPVKSSAVFPTVCYCCDISFKGTVKFDKKKPNETFLFSKSFSMFFIIINSFVCPLICFNFLNSFEVNYLQNRNVRNKSVFTYIILFLPSQKMVDQFNDISKFVYQLTAITENQSQ